MHNKSTNQVKSKHQQQTKPQAKPKTNQPKAIINNNKLTVLALTQNQC